jgi:5-methyltetrahydrofolate--homocysteine methyltransferase
MGLISGSPGVVLLDGAMGTGLHARGLVPTNLPERWLLERPEAVIAVHGEHVAAGAQAVLTCTFNAHPPRLRSERLETFTREIRRGAVAAARAAGAKWVVGLVGPMHPSTDAFLVHAYAEAAAHDFRLLGVDALVVETITQLEEGAARVGGAAASGLDVVACVVPGTPAGATGERAVRELGKAGARVLGVNCALPADCGPLLSAMRAAGAGLLWAKPSAVQNGISLSAEEFANGAVRLVQDGVRFVGGCCGAGAEHLQRLAQMLVERGSGSLESAPERGGFSSQEGQRG